MWNLAGRLQFSVTQIIKKNSFYSNIFYLSVFLYTASAWSIRMTISWYALKVNRLNLITVQFTRAALRSKKLSIKSRLFFGDVDNSSYISNRTIHSCCCSFLKKLTAGAVVVLFWHSCHATLETDGVTAEIRWPTAVKGLFTTHLNDILVF